jgi:hypothetical protein
MTLYSVILFLHLLGALILFAALALEWICLRQLRQATSLDQFRDWTTAVPLIPRFNAFAGPLVFFPGAYLATKMKAWPQGWISMALLAVVAIIALGAGVSGPRMRRLVKASKQSDAVLADLVGRARARVFRLSFRLRMALGLAAVFLMGSKSPIGVSGIVMGGAATLGLLFGLMGM